MIDEATRAEVERVLSPLSRWGARCHAASLELVRSGVLGGLARVARGACDGVGGQHSWVVLGGDCYARDALIVDPTLWSYREDVDDVWFGSYEVGWHRPHGQGSIWQWGRPPRADEMGEEPLELTPRQPWSEEAVSFLAALGRLGLRGWVQLAHAPVEGWPAAEIIDAMCETPNPRLPEATLGGYVPIDIVGMLTDRNPRGLYLPAEVEA
jgi:hypothetical protein